MSIRPFCRLLCFFIVYAFLGWVIDTSFRSLTAGTFAPNSVTPLPFTPIYGFGALFILLAAESVKRRHIILQFLIYGAAASFVEYTGALLTQFFLSRRLWDYSQSPFNLQGNIDIFHTIAWGLLGLFLVHVLHPRLARLL